VVAILNSDPEHWVKVVNVIEQDKTVFIISILKGASLYSSPEGADNLKKKT
jgi:hypothetical protein